MDKFIHIRSPKFPILPSEKEELVNEGMYGKAVAEYLQAKLQDRGYDAPFYCCEDWGWWLELKNAPLSSPCGKPGCVRGWEMRTDGSQPLH